MRERERERERERDETGIHTNKTNKQTNINT